MLMPIASANAVLPGGLIPFVREIAVALARIVPALLTPPTKVSACTSMPAAKAEPNATNCAVGLATALAWMNPVLLLVTFPVTVELNSEMPEATAPALASPMLRTFALALAITCPVLLTFPLKVVAKKANPELVSPARLMPLATARAVESPKPRLGCTLATAVIVPPFATLPRKLLNSTLMPTASASADVPPIAAAPAVMMPSFVTFPDSDETPGTTKRVGPKSKNCELALMSMPTARARSLALSSPMADACACARITPLLEFVTLPTKVDMKALKDPVPPVRSRPVASAAAVGKAVTLLNTCAWASAEILPLLLALPTKVDAATSTPAASA